MSTTDEQVDRTKPAAAPPTALLFDPPYRDPRYGTLREHAQDELALLWHRPYGEIPEPEVVEPVITEATPAPVPAFRRVTRRLAQAWLGLGITLVTIVFIAILIFDEDGRDDTVLSSASTTLQFVFLLGWIFAVPFLVSQFGRKGARKLRKRHKDAIAAASAQALRRNDENARHRIDQAERIWLSNQKDLRDEADLPQSTAEMSTFGQPGAGLSRGRFGAAAETGRLGEETTAAILEELLKDFPNAKILHGLRWPGAGNADIDHVVVVGRKVAVIDSKLWKAGHYWWDGKELYHEGAKLEKVPQTAAQVDAIRLCIASCTNRYDPAARVEVRGFVAIHSPDPDRPVVIDIVGDAPTTFMPGPALAGELRRFFDGQDNRLVDRVLLQLLLPLVKDS